MSGTVWDTMRYGSRPRRTTLKRAIRTARATPTVAPISNPSKASLNEYHTPARITRQICLLDVRLSVSNSRDPMSQTWGIALRLVFGRMFQPNTSPPPSGPSHLYSSHDRGDEGQGNEEEDRLAHAWDQVFARTWSASAGITCSP